MDRARRWRRGRRGARPRPVRRGAPDAQRAPERAGRPHPPRSRRAADRAVPHRWPQRGRLPRRPRSMPLAEQLGTTAAVVEAVLLKIQACDPDRRLRPRRPRMPRAPAARARPARSADAAAARQSRSPRRPRHARRSPAPSAPIARISRHAGRAASGSIPSPAAASRPARSKPWCPTSSCARARAAAGPIELNSDILPRVLVNRTYYATVTKQGPRRRPKRAFLTDCLADRQLADQEPRPARPDHPQGRDRDREAAGRLPRSTASRTCGR